MADIIDFLNKNSGALTTVFSFFVTGATVVYAILTFKLVTETRMLREVQTEPQMSVTFQIRDEYINFIDVVIQNIGLGPAYDVKFLVEPDVQFSGGKSIGSIGFVKKGMRYFAPSQRLNSFLLSIVDEPEEKKGIPINVTVTYKSRTGKQYQDVFLLDLSEFINLVRIDEPPLITIARNIKKMQEDTHKLTTGFSKIQVIAYTPDEFRDAIRNGGRDELRQWEKIADDDDPDDKRTDGSAE